MILSAEIHENKLLNTTRKAVQRLDNKLLFGYSSGSFLSKVTKQTVLLKDSFRALRLLKSAALAPHDIACTLTKDKKEIEGC